MINDRFIARTWQITAIVWAPITVVLAVFGLWYLGLGFTIGTAVSIGVLVSLNMVVRRAFVPGATGAMKALVRFGIVKIFAIAAILIAVVLMGRVDIIVGFCVGLLMTQAIMFVRVIGMSLAGGSGD